jgi:hypothetical protein
MLSALVNTVIAFVITTGFWGVGRFRRSNAFSVRGSHLLLAAAVACGLLHAIALAGPFFSKQWASWQLNLAVVALYSVLVGAVTAFVLILVTKRGQHAA